MRSPIYDTIAEIRLSVLKNNLRQVIARIGKRKIIAVVKADAYGHGAVPVARSLLAASRQVVMLGVASLDEGIRLREAKINAPILLMTGCPTDGLPEVVRYRLTPALYNESALLELSRLAKRTGQGIPVHIKIDTGMGRLGLPPEKTVRFLQKAEGAGVRVEGLFSHFAEADLANLSYAREQLARFEKIAASLATSKSPFCHMANSAAVLALSEAHLDGVRPGLMLYGYSPFPTQNGLEPVLTVKSRILSIKKVAAGTSISYGRTFVTQRTTRVAVAAIGYADGYPRALSNTGEMIAQGRRVPVIGRVCMDMTMLDVTDRPSLRVGDWVTVMGREGKEAIGADTLAEKTQTIPYEILCGIKTHIPRIYT